MKRKHIKLIVLNLAAVAFSFLLVEVTAWVSLKIISAQQKTHQHSGDRGGGVSVDTPLRARIELLDRLGSSAEIPNGTIKDLNAFWKAQNIKSDKFILNNPPLSRVLSCIESDGPLVFNVDRYGFRNDDGKIDALLEGTDLLMVGDSFFEGSCVPLSQSIAATINSFGISVYNGAKGGTGLAYFSASAHKTSHLFRPRVIAVGVLQGASINRAVGELELFPMLTTISQKNISFFKAGHKKSYLTYLLKRALEELAVEREKASQLRNPSIVQSAKLMLKSSSLYRAVRAFRPLRIEYEGEGVPSCDFIRKNHAVIERSVSRIVRASEAVNARLVFFYLPNSFNFLSDVDSSFDTKMKLGAQCEKSAINRALRLSSSSTSLVDLTSAFDGFSDAEVRSQMYSDNYNYEASLRPYMRGHNSAKGYHLLGKEISRYVIDILGMKSPE